MFRHPNVLEEVAWKVSELAPPLMITARPQLNRKLCATMDQCVPSSLCFLTVKKKGSLLSCATACVQGKIARGNAKINASGSGDEQMG
jgi:hypothetical protein